MSESVRYQARFPATLTEDAGRRFTDYVYRRMFGWKIAAAMLVNLAGCIAMVLLSGWTAPTIALCALICIAALYFVGNYFMRPRVMSQRLLRTFGPGATITLRRDGFDLEVGPNKLTRPWGRQRAILESDQYFLLVILPSICLVLPRQDMPSQGEAFVRAAMAGPMTRSPFPGA